jgi:serine/threonine-protein kinase
VSPDGQQIAVHLFEEGRENAVADLRRGTLMRLTFDPAEDETPVWSPDGLFVAYSADRAGDTRAVFRKRADGTGQEEELWTGKGHIHLGSWTGDGKMIVVAAQGQESFDIQTLTIGDKQLKPLFSSRFNETDPSLSPDGRWLAYTSNESGSEEVFVQPFPGLSGRWQISVGGGKQPVWSRDGRELFYRSERHLMAVDVSTTPTFTPGQPKPLFEDNFVSTQGGSHTAYDVMPDGRSFLAVIESAADTSTVTSVPIVLEWFADLKRRLQSAR